MFIGTIQEQVPTVSAGGNPWIATVSLNGLPTEFKIDTGADVTVITEAAIANFDGITLEPASKSLSGPSQHPLHVCGQFTGILSHGTEKVEEEIFVVKGLQMSAGTPCHRSFGTSDQSECDRESGEPHRQVPGTLQRSRNTEGRVPHQA